MALVLSTLRLGCVQITVKAGSCREQYNSLNADCATMKQGLANLGLNSQTVVEENKDNSLSGSEAAGKIILLLFMSMYKLGK